MILDTIEVLTLVIQSPPQRAERSGPKLVVPTDMDCHHGLWARTLGT